MVVADFGQYAFGSLSKRYWWIRTQQDLPGCPGQPEARAGDAGGEPAGLATALGRFP
jgi:hypothetical protein